MNFPNCSGAGCGRRLQHRGALDRDPGLLGSLEGWAGGGVQEASRVVGGLLVWGCWVSRVLGAAAGSLQSYWNSSDRVLPSLLAAPSAVAVSHLMCNSGWGRAKGSWLMGPSSACLHETSMRQRRSALQPIAGSLEDHQYGKSSPGFLALLSNAGCWCSPWLLACPAWQGEFMSSNHALHTPGACQQCDCCPSHGHFRPLAAYDACTPKGPGCQELHVHRGDLPGDRPLPKALKRTSYANCYAAKAAHSTAEPHDLAPQMHGSSETGCPAEH